MGLQQTVKELGTSPGMPGSGIARSGAAVSCQRRVRPLLFVSVPQRQMLRPRVVPQTGSRSEDSMRGEPKAAVKVERVRVRGLAGEMMVRRNKLAQVM